MHVEFRGPPPACQPAHVRLLWLWFLRCQHPSPAHHTTHTAAAILVWEEVWDLPQTAYLSSWLLLIITFGAMIGSWHFERRIWCR